MNEKDAANTAHRNEASSQLTAMGRKMFKFIEFDSGEDLVAEIRKHPIGLIAITVVGLFISLAVLAATLALAGNLEVVGFGESETLRAILVFVGIILSFLILAMTLISSGLYVRNVIFVTTEKIAEVSYISLFNRKVNQLGIGQLQDVTVLQKGILPHLFDYGTIIIETAGEKETTMFTLVPSPNKYSQVIIETHEESVRRYGN